MAKPEFAQWVDVNGTLVRHAKGGAVWDDKGEVIIGPPIPSMVQWARKELARGQRIVLKSAMEADPDPKKRAKAKKAFGDWSERVLGKRLEVTATCRPEFWRIIDDKAGPKVVRNEGFAETTSSEEKRDGREPNRSRRKRRDKPAAEQREPGGDGWGKWEKWGPR